MEVAQVLDLLQQRHTMQVLQQLLDGPAGYQELRRALAPIGSTTLARRIRSLEEAGLVVREGSAASPSRARYLLTPAGYQLRGVMAQFEAWAIEHLAPHLPAVADAAEPPHAELEAATYRLVQQRWVPQLLQWLHEEGPSGFNELQRGLGASNAAVLAERLSHLEGLGLLTRTVLSERPPRNSYRLTASGAAFGAVLEAVHRWALANSG